MPIATIHIMMGMNFMKEKIMAYIFIFYGKAKLTLSAAKCECTIYSSHDMYTIKYENKIRVAVIKVS